MLERARVCSGKYIGNISIDAGHPPPCPPANSRESVGLWLDLKNMSPHPYAPRRAFGSRKPPPASFSWLALGSFSRANRQRVMFIVHFRFNMLSWANASGHLGSFIDMQTHLRTVILIDEVVTGFNVQYFALNCVDAIQGQTQAH